jgi:hypothetical protein
MTGSGGGEFGAERAATDGDGAMQGRALVYASPVVEKIATVLWRRGELPRPAAFQP